MPANHSPSFSSLFDSQFSFGQDGELTGRFGLNVLDDLIAGIDEFRAAAARRSSFSYLGPGMLGAFGWLDDWQLLRRIAEYPNACVAFTKQPRPFKPRKLASLRDTMERCGGFPSAALPELETLAPRDEHGQPQMIGPHARMPTYTVPGLRTVGYRKTGNTIAPLLHVKMVLLGDLSWHEYEGEFGSVTETLKFEPQRLWIGSANGTYSSRFSLEFGCWQTEPKLLAQAKRFLTQVIAHSEDLDPDSDTMEPDLVDVEYDHAAMADALAELEPDDAARAEAMAELAEFLDEQDEQE
jgi:hypothetical protein